MYTVMCDVMLIQTENKKQNRKEIVAIDKDRE